MTYIVIPVQGTGSIKLSDLVPITDGSTPGPGLVGEIQTVTNAVPSAIGIGATGVWGAATSLALTAGTYYIFGTAIIDENAAVLTSKVSVGISDSSTGASITDYAESAPFLSGSPIRIIAPTIRVSIAAGNTYYLNTKFNYSSGTPNHAGSMWAIRYS